MTTSRRMGRLAALLLAGSLALTACARSGDDTDGGSGTGGENNTPDDHFVTGVYQKEASGDPVQGGTLTFADFAENRSLDPSKTIATGFSGGAPLVAVYDQLVRWNVETQDWEPRLAESIEPNEDHSVWTVTLRDAQFSDGTPVNADAVIGSVNYYLQNQGYDAAVIAPMWKGIEKIDDKTVEFQLQGPWTTFPNMLGQGIGFIVAPAAIAGGPDAFEPIGAGPFTYESYQPQEELVVAANPDFWDGQPYLEKVRFVWLGSDDARVDLVKGGGANVGITNNSKWVWDLREEDMSGAMEINAQNALLMINQSRGPGTELKVRQAMGYAIDTEAVNDRARDGKGMPNHALFGPWSKWASGVETLNYDPEKAKTLLEEAKAEGYDGKVAVTGLSSSQDTILMIVANLEAVGFEVEQDLQRNVADYTTKIFIEKNYEVGTGGLSYNEADPYQRLYSSLHSESFANALGVKDPELDELIEELRGTALDDRGDVLKRIDERYQETVPAVTLSAGTNFIYWNDNVHGVFATNDSMVDFSKTWIE
ncbi:MAG: ABC transporter substrate-binding protein [Propionibacterium sp.]|nr:ABC transporter substrate-binding protein [Propionibacterium sp.]